MNWRREGVEAPRVTSSDAAGSFMEPRDGRVPVLRYLGRTTQTSRSGVPEGNLLLRVDERDRGRPAGPLPTVRGEDLQVPAGPAQLDRQPDVADVLLEARRPDQVGDRAHRLSVHERRTLLRQLERQRIALELDADQLP